MMKRCLINFICCTIMIFLSPLEMFSQGDSDSNVDQGLNNCITVSITTGCQQKVFPLGAKVCFHLDAYVPYAIQDKSDECHNVPHPYYNWLPKYDGIKEDRFSINSFKKVGYYSTTSFWNKQIPGTYYDGHDFSVVLDFPGTNYAVYEVKGGYFEYGTSTVPKGELLYRHLGGRDEWGRLEFLVVKCDQELYFNNDCKNEVFLDFEDNPTKRIGAGDVFFSSFSLESNEKKAVEAYKSIVLKPGVYIKNGATFYAKALSYPTVENCDCSSSSRMLKSEVPTDVNFIGYDKEYVKIFYSSSDRLISIEGIINSNIRNVYVYEISGRMVLDESFNDVQNCSISTHTLSKGIYVVQVYTNNGFVSKKVVI